MPCNAASCKAMNALSVADGATAADGARPPLFEGIARFQDPVAKIICVNNAGEANVIRLVRTTAGCLEFECAHKRLELSVRSRKFR